MMEKSITCFIETGTKSDLKITIEGLLQNSCVKQVFIVSEQKPDQDLLTNTTGC